MNSKQEERRFDLLEKRTFDGLTPAEERELAELNGDGDLSLELTAAAFSLSQLNEIEPMPAHIRAKIEDDAEGWLAGGKTLVIEPGRRETEGSTAGGNRWNWLGWAVAVAACLVLAANVYFTRINPSPVIVSGPTPTPTIEQLSPAQMRERLIASAGDVAKADIAAGKESYKPTGDIVWSDAKQAGYIRITGLPKNDPGKEQYQLWIFDENQDPKTPIDGGVFDASSDGEIVIPINAKIKVKGAKVFAITVEKPGGVVVSKQEKVAALAKVET
jgi:anti-sigma-K factor RskA